MWRATVYQLQRSSLPWSCTEVLPKPQVRCVVPLASRSFTIYLVIGTADEVTGQAVFAFVTLKPCVIKVSVPYLGEYWHCCNREFAYDANNEASLTKELILQVRKVIGPFAAPKKVIIVPDLPKTRSGKVCHYDSPMGVAGAHITCALDHAPYHAQDCRWWRRSARWS